MAKGKNDEAWEWLFDKYDILNRIEDDGRFYISANQIKAVREPRLMAKFDHAINLPKIFSDNRLSILPISRGDYVISHFEAYHKLPLSNGPATRLYLPLHLQSLNANHVPSEAIALNCAIASGMIADFLQDDRLVATVSGRMGSGEFGFNINNAVTQKPCSVIVKNSQIEIDAAYEGLRSLTLFEAKKDLSEDFLVRQLYYPFRVWHGRVTKPIRPLFLIYSNGIYHLFEYMFNDPLDYNSIALVQQKNYTIENTCITLTDIKQVLDTTPHQPEQAIQFPQADKFERIINLCELLGDRDLDHEDITTHYDFDVRQARYYIDAARYLGLVTKVDEVSYPLYRLSSKGVLILNMPYIQRQLELCRCILSHEVFSCVLAVYFKTGSMPNTPTIVQIMQSVGLYNIHSHATYTRRASTVKSWVNWIIRLAG